jgi:aminoglycoside/choline kinase family phosphotransferase
MEPEADVGQVRSWIEACHAVAVVSLVPITGGAGARRYARIHFADGSSAIWMHARPEDPEILPPALRGPAQELPFVTVSRLLADHGLPVPQVFAVHHDEPWILLEDLGDLHVFDLPHDQRLARQSEAIGLLSRVHSIPRGDGMPFSRHFDQEWIGFELEHFMTHAVNKTARSALRPGLEELGRQIARLPQTLCLRDYHCQNLMVDANGELRIIDYQDALLAPPELDLAALVYDSYVELTEDERRGLLEHYAELRGQALDPTALALLVIQRKCKDLGRFKYLAHQKHDLRFSPYAASAAAAIRSALPALPAGLEALGARLGDVISEDTE